MSGCSDAIKKATNMFGNVGNAIDVQTAADQDAQNLKKLNYWM